MSASGPGAAAVAHAEQDYAPIGAPALSSRPRWPWATGAHLVTLAGALAFWAWLDRGLWFFGDEWEFLVNRGLAYAPSSRHSIWFPHNEHWSALPVLLWRILFNLWHLGSYWPYLVPVLLAHVGIMHLLWRLSLRNGAGPWISTVAVGLLGFLGAGAEDLAWAFQIGFVGSVLFGLLAFEFLDLPAPGAARQYCASVALLAALMCSTIGDSMLVGAAFLAFARLPARRASIVIGPPLAAYLLWFATIGRLGLAEHSDRFPLSTFTGVPAYVWTGLSSALGQVFNLSTAGPAILVGLAAWVGWHLRELWSGNPALVSAAVAVVAFYVLAALGRDVSTTSPTVSRYIYIAFALLLPLVAKLLSSLGPWPAARAGAAVLLAFTALGNVDQAQSWTGARQLLTSQVKTEVAATRELLMAGARDVSGTGAAPVAYSPNLSVAALLRLARADQLPAMAATAQQRLNARAVLAVGAWNGLDMTLTKYPLSSGHFRFIKEEGARESPGRPGCLTFSPLAASLPVEIWLGFTVGGRSAAVELSAPAAPPDKDDYVGVQLVSVAPPAFSAPVELTVPARGAGYLDDNFNGADLVLTWDDATVLTACGL
ncbi:MAG TPA: hypothetical protein VK425_11315 [Acidimicrobiales bacterium]|nr:hypothetical protein [Acidimicrobiales bacterium]